MDLKNSELPLFAKKALQAMEVAVRKVHLEYKRLGLPIYIWEKVGSNESLLQR